MTSSRRFRHVALLALGFAGTSSGVLLKASQSQELSSEGRRPASQQVMHSFRAKILMRFAHVDADGDGKVSLAEMRSGFGHEPAHVGEGLLREMMAACAGGDAQAMFCTQEQMKSSLDKWVDSHKARSAMALLQTDAHHGFVHVHGHRHAGEGDADGEPEGEPQLCGPSVETPPGKGLEGVKCTVRGPKCVGRGTLVAWSLNNICRGRTCICEATAETKRLAKLGLTGAAAVTTAINFTDPDDELLMPDCGRDWSGTKLVGRMGELQNTMSFVEKPAVKAMMKYFAPTAAENFTDTDYADTEVALFRSNQHELVKGSRNGKVCMFSWQATRSAGDWILNLLLQDMPFKYAPRGSGVSAGKGLVLSYDSVRPHLLKAFEEQCCAPGSEVEKLVISGHSHGGAMALLHSVDVVTNWKCNGRDLGAKDLAVILVAPHMGMFTSSAVNKVFSCNDPANCLAGSVLTMVTEGDYVGDGHFSMRHGNIPRHASEVFKMPCPSIPDGANYNGSMKNYEDFWCHGLYNYVGQAEQLLVGKAGWGSTCGGSCGNPNRMVQCNQWAVMTFTGCSYANSSWLKTPTECPDSRWLPAEERCDCHFDLCTDLTKHGCAA